MNCSYRGGQDFNLKRMNTRICDDLILAKAIAVICTPDAGFESQSRKKKPLRTVPKAFLLSDSTDWIKREQDSGEQVAQSFQVITFPQREYCTRYATMNSN